MFRHSNINMRAGCIFSLKNHTPSLKFFPHYSKIWFDLIWFGLVWFGLIWFGLVWFGLTYRLCRSRTEVGWRGKSERGEREKSPRRGFREFNGGSRADRTYSPRDLSPRTRYKDQRHTSTTLGPRSSVNFDFRLFAKELSICRKLWFSNPYISATQCRRH